MRIFAFLFTLFIIAGFLGCHADVNVIVDITTAKINLKQDFTDIPNDSGIYDFGDVQINSQGNTVEFTIVNPGFADLELTIPQIIEITGSNASDFEININSTDSIIESGASTTFTITFKPTSLDSKFATVKIPNNTPVSPYTFEISGKGINQQPEINVKQGDDNIESSTGLYDFGSVYLGESSNVITFTIENLGSKTLNLTGNPVFQISGTNASEFSVDSNSTDTTILANGYTIFTIIFTPTTDGNKTATISIDNDDNDENPYTFTIFGISVIPKPEINVKQDTNDIPNSTGEYDFGRVSTGYSSANVTFTIENLGVADLDLTGNPIVTISGIDASEFSLNLNSISTPVAPNSETKFKVKFSPTTSGIKQATITIENNDSDENPYTFTIKGEGSDYVKGDFNGDGFQDFVIGASDSDAGGLNSGCAYIFFGRQNWSSSIDASNASVKIVGEDTGDGFGYSVASAGDINDDGIADIVISGLYDNSGGANSGTVYLFFGRQNWNSSIDATDANVIIAGEASFDRFGCSVSYAGDVNADGIDDILVGAYLNDGSATDSGTSYVFFGRQNWNKNIDASNANVKIYGDSADDAMGFSVSYAGDVNHDGKDDFVVGASQDSDGGPRSGCAFIFFGRQSWNSSYSASNGSVKLIGEDNLDRFGASVSYAGDMNNDGKDDIIVGAWGDDDGGAQSGCAFIFFGRQNWSSSVDASNASVKIVGEDTNDYFGSSVGYAGDVNDDGIDDFIVGAPQDDDGGDGSGCAFIFHGRSYWSATTNASLAAVKLVGGDPSDYFGQSVYTTGDINKDGMFDIIVGAVNDDDGTTDSGCAFIFRGRQNWSSKIDATAANTKLIGEEGYDRFGNSVSGN